MNNCPRKKNEEKKNLYSQKKHPIENNDDDDILYQSRKEFFFRTTTTKKKTETIGVCAFHIIWTVHFFVETEREKKKTFSHSLSSMVQYFIFYFCCRRC